MLTVGGGFLAVVLVVVLVGLAWTSQSTANRLSGAETQLSSTQAQLAAAQAQVVSLRAEVASQQAQSAAGAARFEAELSDLKGELTRLEGRLSHPSNRLIVQRIVTEVTKLETLIVRSSPAPTPQMSPRPCHLHCR